MYDKGISALGTTAATSALAFTGADVLWLILGSFALIAAGLAVLRTLPRHQA
jgi:hypothetical protein